MKGHQQVIDLLNRAIASEHTAIASYVTDANVQENWHLSRISKKTMERALQEMKHLDRLIERVVFLEGIPATVQIDPFKIGQTPLEQVQNQLVLELDGIVLYNEIIRVATDMGDDGSRLVAEKNLKDEEHHAEYLEAQIEQAKLMTPENWVSTLA